MSKLLSELIEQQQEKIKRNKQIDETPTEKLFKKGNKYDLYKQCKSITIEKYNSNTMKDLTVQEAKCFEEAINYIHELLPDKSSMVKVIPQCEIKKYLEFNYGIYTYMLRKADFNSLLDSGLYKSKYEILYNVLVLNYPHNNFNERDDYIAVVSTKIPKFANRNPISLKNERIIKGNGNLIIKDKDSHYTGVGFTAHKYGVMEFYVSISAQYHEDGKKNYKRDCCVEEKEGIFPIKAFYTDIFLINKKTNEMFLLALYDNEMIDGENVYEKFQYPIINNGVAKKAANELGLKDLIK